MKIMLYFLINAIYKTKTNSKLKTKILISNHLLWLAKSKIENLVKYMGKCYKVNICLHLLSFCKFGNYKIYRKIQICIMYAWELISDTLPNNQSNAFVEG